MKILHVCLSNFFIDNVSYQENLLIKYHVLAGHEVKVLASTEVFDKDKKITYTNESTYIGEHGVEITRIGYFKGLPLKLMAKLRIHSGVFDYIEKYSPDIIMFHSVCGWELLTIREYSKKHPEVIIYYDSHEDFNNSAKSFISKHFLHYLYYRPIAKITSKYAKKILCISLETIDFLSGFYGIPENKLEFYPLGGEIKSDDDYKLSRNTTRSKYNLTDNSIVFIQTGKLTKRKKLLVTLDAFKQNTNKNFKLLIVGLLDESIKAEAMKIINSDNRIEYLGWKDTSDMDGLLDAADVYIQPGTQSVTLQASMCARCAVIIDNVKSHAPYMKGNGWFASDFKSINHVFNEIKKKPDLVKSMGTLSFDIAKVLLDYKKLADRVTK